jgi:hypothetical protein
MNDLPSDLFNENDDFDLPEHGTRKEPVGIQALIQKIKAAGKREVGRKKHENKSQQIINVNNARLHENEKSTVRDRVFHSHERMGHPPEDVMCIAIDGENPTWINATVTTKQIRKVFSREPCLACVIGKRNHDSGRYL